MEELLLKNGQEIPTDGVKVVQNAKISVKTITDSLNRSKAYYNALAAMSVEDYLTRLGVLKKEIPNMRSSAKLLVDFEVADVRLPNLHIDVRAVFDEDELFIPKKHFENKILPDIYLFVKFNQDLNKAELLGFVTPKTVNMKNCGDEYYFVNKSSLMDLSLLTEIIEKTPEKKEKALSKDEKAMAEKLIMLYEDSDILPERLSTLLSYLNEYAEVREKLIEFESFEQLSYMALQEFKDLNLENNDFSKYIRSLVNADEFEAFDNAEDMALSAATEQISTKGLFIDDEVLKPSVDVVNENVSELFTGVVKSDDENDEEIEVVDGLSAEDGSEEQITLEDELQEEILSVQDVSQDEISDVAVAENITEENIQPVDEFEAFETKDEFDMSETSVEINENELAENTETDNIVAEELPEAVEDVTEEISEEETPVEPIVIEEETNIENENILDDASQISDEEISLDVPEENLEIEELSALDEVTDDVQNEELMSDENSEVTETSTEETSEVMASDEEIANSVENIEAPILDEDLELNIDELSVDNNILEDNSLENTEENKEPEEEFNLEAVGEELQINDDEINAVETSDDNVDFGTALTDEDDLFHENSEEPAIVFEESPIEELNVSETLDLDENPLDSETVIGLTEGVMDIDTSKEDATEQFEFIADGEDVNAISDVNITPAEPVISVTDDEIDSAIAQSAETTQENVEDLNFSATQNSDNFITDEDFNSNFFNTEKNVENAEDNSASADLTFFNDDEISGSDAVQSDEEFNVTQEEQDTLDSSELDEIFNEENVGDLGAEVVEEAAGEGNADTDFAFALDTPVNKSSSSKKVAIALAATALIGLAGAGTVYMMSHNKSAQNDMNVSEAQTNDVAEDNNFDIDNVIDNVDTENVAGNEEILNTEATEPESKPDVVADVKIPQPKAQDGVNAPEPVTMQKIKRDFSQPNTYLSVSKVVWGVPEYLTYNDDFSQYLQRLGSMVKINLSNDLLLVTENPVLNSVKVKIMLTANGSKFDVSLAQGCGAKTVDDLVLQSVKSAMNAQRPPVSSLDTADEELILTIQL